MSHYRFSRRPAVLFGDSPHLWCQTTRTTLKDTDGAWFPEPKRDMLLRHTWFAVDSDNNGEKAIDLNELSSL